MNIGFVLLVMQAFQGIANAQPLVVGTTLSAPETSFQTLKAIPANIQVGNLLATLADNQGFGKIHREGYNGITQLRLGSNPSPFVDAYAGLNLEHVNNGIRYDSQNLQFEPRKHPMEIRKINEHTYELYQKPLPNIGLENCTRFTFKNDGTIDVTFECIPRKNQAPYDYLNIFWASYIQNPEDPAIYFVGRKKGAQGEDWIRAISPKHGELSTHRSATDKRNFRRDEPFPLTLVFNESNYEYTKSFYYGRYGDYTLAMLFQPKDQIRFTQSPSGGGQGNPAWDFQWFINSPQKNNLYQLRFRILWKKWINNAEILQNYQTFTNTRQEGN